MTDLTELAQRWATLQEQQPHLRTREAALRLGATELELVSTRPTTIHLSGTGLEWLGALEAVGPMMALTRNDTAVIEKDGRYRNLDFNNPHVGNVLDEGIDLRVFLRHWRYAVAVSLERRNAPPLRGIGIFDDHGEAVHKVWLRPESDVEAFDALVERFRTSAPDLSLTPPPDPPDRAIPEAFDRERFQAEWMAMTDTHDFYFLLHRHGLARTTGLSNAPADMAREVDVGMLQRVLEGAAAAETPIMVFVGSRGCIEIHTGPVRRVVSTRGWLNVLDEGFNLHVREAGLARAWVVRKPTEDGIVTSLEVYDEAGETVCLLFGVRKPGMPEDERWRALLSAATG